MTSLPSHHYISMPRISRFFTKNCHKKVALPAPPPAPGASALWNRLDSDSQKASTKSCQRHHQIDLPNSAPSFPQSSGSVLLMFHDVWCLRMHLLNHQTSPFLQDHKKGPRSTCPVSRKVHQYFAGQVTDPLPPLPPWLSTKSRRPGVQGQVFCPMWFQLSVCTTINIHKRASAWNSDALGPKFGHHNLPKGVLDFHGAQPGFFSATKRKTHGGRWTAPKKSSKKPKFHPSIQGACEGITQTVCDGNLRGSSVRHRVAGFSKKNPWRQPSPQIILKARNPVWSGGRVEKTQVTSANAHVRMHPFTHECACMHGMYVRADGPT